MDDCVICKLVNGELEATKIYEDDRVVAVMDIQPINTGHLLVSPKEHYQYVYEMDEELGGHMFKVAMRMSIALRHSGVTCDGINFFIADGKAALQEVPHVHLHVIPRIEGDGFGFQFPRDYFRKHKREELEEVAGLIKEALDKIRGV